VKLKKRLSLVFAAAAVCAFVGVSSASAATEFGSGCVATGAAPFNIISLGHGTDSPLPVAAPVSGVITQWTVKADLGEGELTPEEAAILTRLYRQTLDVYKPAGGNSYTLVGEEVGGSLSLGETNVYPARIPVQAGDLLGLGGGLAFYCETTDPGDKVGFAKGTIASGSTAPFEMEETELQVPVVAKIESDIDGDGYGDETQDKCPQSAAYQTACPVVTISSKPLAGRNSVTVYVSTSLGAQVGLGGTVKLGKGKTAKLTAAAQTVSPGQVATFKLTLTGQVNKALKELPTKKALTLSITASATNVTGAPSSSTSKVKLKGLAKPVQSKKNK
jgi:hypothetical protein